MRARGGGVQHLTAIYGRTLTCGVQGPWHGLEPCNLLFRR